MSGAYQQQPPTSYQQQQHQPIQPNVLPNNFRGPAQGKLPAYLLSFCSFCSALGILTAIFNPFFTTTSASSSTNFFAYEGRIEVLDINDDDIGTFDMNGELRDSYTSVFSCGVIVGLMALALIPLTYFGTIPLRIEERNKFTKNVKTIFIVFLCCIFVFNTLVLFAFRINHRENLRDFCEDADNAKACAFIPSQAYKDGVNDLSGHSDYSFTSGFSTSITEGFVLMIILAIALKRHYDVQKNDMNATILVNPYHARNAYQPPPANPLAPYQQPSPYQQHQQPPVAAVDPYAQAPAYGTAPSLYPQAASGQQPAYAPQDNQSAYAPQEPALPRQNQDHSGL